MKCKDYCRKISAYLDTEIDPDQKKIMDQHLQQCQECSKVFSEMKSSWDLLQILPDAEKSPYFYTRLKARINSKEIKQSTWIKRLLYPVTAVAVVMFGVFVGTIAGMNGELSNVESDLEQEIATIFTLDTFDDFPSASFGQAVVEFSDNGQE